MKTFALVTDAGTPGISDPGALLVQQALESGVSVTVIPGPTALIAALVASGLPTHPFAFLGFPPARGSGRRRFFSSYAMLPMTLILYESPQRLQRTLEDMLHSWGNRRIAVARELTKRYEEVFRGTISEALDYYSQGVIGELTLVVAGAGREEESAEDGSNWIEELRHLLREPGMTVRGGHRRNRSSPLSAAAARLPGSAQGQIFMKFRNQLKGAGPIIQIAGLLIVVFLPLLLSHCAHTWRSPEFAEDLVPVHFVYVDAQAREVCLAGSFNQWSCESHCMVASGHNWSIELLLPPGRYQYAFVVNGVKWQIDPDALLTEDDGFGTRNSVLIVE